MLMINPYHLLRETEEPTLVVGMQWRHLPGNPPLSQENKVQTI
jgi:hypothetical protein